MASWLEEKAPRRFDELLLSDHVREYLKRSSLQANPPHLLISGPSGVGKTAAWRLVARQVLGPSWQATTHIIQARDLAKTSGAMKKFEEFLRPEGSSSKDTLAGRTSLDAYYSNLSPAVAGDVAPAGIESSEHNKDTKIPISRIIVIEDADFLGKTRQSYLRRMVEESSRSARFIFTAKTPSRIIEALRSRVQLIRFPIIPREDIESRLNQIITEEGLSPDRGIIGDIAHVSSGNLRKAIFLTQLLSQRNLLNDRKNLQTVLAATSVREIQRVVEEALRGKVHQWRWEKNGSKNSRVLKGAMGQLDELMTKYNFEAEEVVEHFYSLFTASRLHLDEAVLSQLLIALAECDVSLKTSAVGRIQLELFLHQVAEIGSKQVVT
ncbi:AAA family ATPase [Candidatus Poseidoniaceae archaeon]|nr:AAA family ATPase [Candidatus Poseidoniaceae archaeon]|tara:strand:+ start:293 stop:1432 length:1140 start_codon:yes stop_codon:yes gene_type:complete